MTHGIDYSISYPLSVPWRASTEVTHIFRIYKNYWRMPCLWNSRLIMNKTEGIFCRVCNHTYCMACTSFRFAFTSEDLSV